MIDKKIRAIYYVALETNIMRVMATDWVAYNTAWNAKYRSQCPKEDIIDRTLKNLVLNKWRI